MSTGKNNPPTNKKLNESYDDFCNYVEEKIAWYQVNARKKRFASQLSRRGAIFLVIIAGIIPFIQNLTFQEYIFGVLHVDKLATWGYVLLALAGGINLMDRYTGASSGYLRYIATQLEIERLYSEFQLNYHFQSHGTEPNGDEAALKNLILECKDRVDNEIKTETDSWINEFKTSQSELNALLKSKSEEYKKLIQEQKQVKLQLDTPNRKIIVNLSDPSEYNSGTIILNKNGKQVKNFDNLTIKPTIIIPGLTSGSYELLVTLTGSSNLDNEYNIDLESQVSSTIDL